MSDYETNLNDWGDEGVAYPNGYSYKKGEQPVDAWDNYFNYNVTRDIKYLLRNTQRNTVNVYNIYRRLGEHDFQLGLELLNYEDGDYGVYGDEYNIVSKSNFEVVGSEASTRAVLRKTKNLTEVDSTNEADLSLDYVAIGGGSDNIYVYSLSDASLVTTLTDPSGTIDDVNFSPDGNLLAVPSYDGNVYVYDTSDWSLTRTLTKISNYVKQAKFTRDGDHLMYGGYDSKLVVDKVSDWTNETTISVSGSIVETIAVAKEGEMVAWSNRDKMVYIHDTSDWSEITSFTAQITNQVRSLSFSQNDSHLAYNDMNSGEVCIHNVSDWSLEKKLSNAGSNVLFKSTEDKLTYLNSNGNTEVLNVPEWRNINTISGAIYSFYENVFCKQTDTGMELVFAPSSGSITHKEKTLDFVPETVVVSDDEMVENVNYTYKIEDGDGNSVTIDGETEEDSEIPLDFTDKTIQVTIEGRANGKPTILEIYKWAVYFDGGST